MTPPRTYPAGVPCWVDTDQPDPDAARAFYGELLGWEIDTVSPPQAPRYDVATLGGRDVAGLGPASGGEARWNTYVAVDDLDATVAAAKQHGAVVVHEPAEAGPAGAMAELRDPAGAALRLWRAGRRPGAQAVNEPGAWNFSNLRTDDRESELAFYGALLRWEPVDLGSATFLRVPGYGDHLEATVDPEVRDRQAQVGTPVGFEDAVAWIEPLRGQDTAYWHVTFSVADRDAFADRAASLGADVGEREETTFARTARIRDPQGAVFTASQFTPPET